MGKLKVIRESELGSTTSNDKVYPVTTSEAVHVPNVGKLTPHVHPRQVLSKEEFETLLNENSLQINTDYFIYGEENNSSDSNVSDATLKGYYVHELEQNDPYYNYWFTDEDYNNLVNCILNHVRDKQDNPLYGYHLFLNIKIGLPQAGLLPLSDLNSSPSYNHPVFVTVETLDTTSKEFFLSVTINGVRRCFIVPGKSRFYEVPSREIVVSRYFKEDEEEGTEFSAAVFLDKRFLIPGVYNVLLIPAEDHLKSSVEFKLSAIIVADNYFQLLTACSCTLYTSLIDYYTISQTVYMHVPQEPYTRVYRRVIENFGANDNLESMYYSRIGADGSDAAGIRSRFAWVKVDQLEQETSEGTNSVRRYTARQTKTYASTSGIAVSTTDGEETAAEVTCQLDNTHGGLPTVTVSTRESGQSSNEVCKYDFTPKTIEALNTYIGRTDEEDYYFVVVDIATRLEEIESEESEAAFIRLIADAIRLSAVRLGIIPTEESTSYREIITTALREERKYEIPSKSTAVEAFALYQCLISYLADDWGYDIVVRLFHMTTTADILITQYNRPKYIEESELSTILDDSGLTSRVTDIENWEDTINTRLDNLEVSSAEYVTQGQFQNSISESGFVDSAMLEDTLNNYTKLTDFDELNGRVSNIENSSSGEVIEDIEGMLQEFAQLLSPSTFYIQVKLPERDEMGDPYEFITSSLESAEELVGNLQQRYNQTGNIVITSSILSGGSQESLEIKEFVSTYIQAISDVDTHRDFACMIEYTNDFPNMRWPSTMQWTQIGNGVYLISIKLYPMDVYFMYFIRYNSEDDTIVIDWDFADGERGLFKKVIEFNNAHKS